MVIAITAGVILASILFMKEVAEMTKLHDLTDHKKIIPASFPKGWKVFKINGPLFFAAADRILGELSHLCAFEIGLIISLEGVSVLDAGGMSALNRLIEHCRKTKTHLYLTDIQFQPLKTLAQAECVPIPGVVSYCPTLSDALAIVSHT
jgi:SulP family sulfate permease